MAMDRSLKARGLASATLVLVFAAGTAMGLVWDRTLNADPPEADESVAVENDEKDGRRTLLVEQVGLSPDQEEAIFALVDESRRRTKAIEKQFRDEYRPKYREIIKETRAGIMLLLDEAQRAEYEAILEEHDRRRDDRRRDDRDREDRIP